MGPFLRAGFVWLKHVTIHTTLTPAWRLGGTCKAQLPDPSQELFLKQLPLTPKTVGDSEPNEHPKEPCGRREPFAAKKKKTNAPFCQHLFYG